MYEDIHKIHSHKRDNHLHEAAGYINAKIRSFLVNAAIHQ